MTNGTQKNTDRKMVYIVIAAVILILIFIVGMQSGNHKLNSLLDLGQKYLNDMKYEEAIAAFDQAIAIEPKCEQAYMGKARAQYALGQNEQAIETLMLGMEQVEDDSQLSEIYLEILYSDLDNNENAEIKEKTETVKSEVKKNKPFLLNYSQIVRHSNTDEPTVQLEILGEENEELHLTWTSSDENCASVSGDGLVTCKPQQGYAYITVTDGIRSAGCTVRIMDSEPETEKVCIEVEQNGEEKYFSIVLESNDEGRKNGKLDIVSGYMGFIYYSGDVQIPEHLTFKGEDIKIDGISNMAFYASERLTTVKIPASVENIEGSFNMEWNPFKDSINLEEITVDEENEFYKSVDGVLYSKDGRTLLAYPPNKKEKSYTIPKEVESIYQGAFAGNKNLEEIDVEEGNTRYVSLNGVLFDGKEYKLLVYPGNKENSIYQIPKGIQTIGYKAFYGSEVKKIECNPEVTYVEELAFASCKNLEEITGMENVPYITQNLFMECPKLKNIEGGAGTTYISIGTDNIWSGTTNKIMVSGMENMTNLEHLSIPTSAVSDIKVIGSLVNLKELYLYEDTKKIDFNAVEKLGNLESLHLNKVSELSDLSWIKNMDKLQSLSISVLKFTVTDISPLFNTPNLKYIDICPYINGGNEIVLEENLVKQIEELKAEKSDSYYVNIMEQ